jgi:perosamine synthetase
MPRLALLGGTPAIDPIIEFRWPRLSAEARGCVADMIQRGEISYYGSEGKVKELERSCAAIFERTHALATASGTAALHSAFFAAGFGPGDEVIVPSYTFLATVMPLFVTKATPVLVDSEPDTGNIDPGRVEQAITSRTRGLVVTHMWGHPCDMDRLVPIARRHQLVLIEDCSHAHGSAYKGRQVGTFGDIAVYSMGAQKLVSGGMGGVLLTDSQEYFDRAVLFGHFNKRAEQSVRSPRLLESAYTGLGLNYRMHPFAAALILDQIPSMQDVIAARHRNLSRLSSLIDGISGIEPPVTRPYAFRGAFYGYYPLIDPGLGVPRDLFVEAVSAEGCPTRVPQYRPLHTLPVFQESSYYRNLLSRAYSSGELPVSMNHWTRTFPIPTFTGEEERWKVDAYAEAIAKVVANISELRSLSAERGTRPSATGRAKVAK